MFQHTITLLYGLQFVRLMMLNYQSLSIMILDYQDYIELSYIDLWIDIR